MSYCLNELVDQLEVKNAIHVASSAGNLTIVIADSAVGSGFCKVHRFKV